MAFFDPDGKKVAGRLAAVGKGVPLDEITQAVAEAVVRCERGASAKEEMATLFKRYQQLKENRWEPFEHPMSPLMEWFVKQKFE